MFQIVLACYACLALTGAFMFEIDIDLLRLARGVLYFALGTVALVLVLFIDLLLELGVLQFLFHVALHVPPSSTSGPGAPAPSPRPEARGPGPDSRPRARSRQLPPPRGGGGRVRSRWWWWGGRVAVPIGCCEIRPSIDAHNRDRRRRSQRHASHFLHIGQQASACGNGGQQRRDAIVLPT